METKFLHIKNMVCNRCIKVVREEMEKLNYRIEEISLGEVKLSSDDEINVEQIKIILEKNGFELIDTRNSRIIEKIKVLIIERIHDLADSKLDNVDFSKLLSENLNLSYQYLSNLFSSIEGTTIEKFIILQKIEKVKELLVYDEFTLSEIAYRLDYSSVQHLSNQFKKITGLTPSYFKSLKDSRRKPLDKLI